MNALLRAALGYAARGWRVFPVHGIVRGQCTCGRVDCSSPGKHPLVRRGLHDATTKTSVIRAWWGQWPRANVAIETGRASGIVVVDLDFPAALGSLHVLTRKLPRTLTSLSGGGGIHLLLRAPADRFLHNHTSRLPGIAQELPGVDVRGEGGYVLAPPSLHVSSACYEWLDRKREMADAPSWLRESQRRPIVTPTAAASFDGDGTRVGLKVLRRQLDVLRRAREGERNHTLNRCAFVVARYVAAGHLREGVARGELTRAALGIGLTAWETGRTIDSAFGAVASGSIR